MTSLHCLHDFMGLWEGKKKIEGTLMTLQRMELGGGVGDRSLHSCKEFLDAFTFPSEEEMKAPVNKPIHPISVSSSQSLRQRKAMLKHQ